VVFTARIAEREKRNVESQSRGHCGKTDIGHIRIGTIAISLGQKREKNASKRSRPADWKTGHRKKLMWKESHTYRMGRGGILEPYLTARPTAGRSDLKGSMPRAKHQWDADSLCAL